MPRYEVTSSHGNGGGVFLAVGEIVELTPQDGAWRTRVNLVKPYVDPADASAAPAEPIAPSPAAGGIAPPAPAEPPVADPVAAEVVSGELPVDAPADPAADPTLTVDADPAAATTPDKPSKPKTK